MSLTRINNRLAVASRGSDGLLVLTIYNSNGAVASVAELSQDDAKRLAEALDPRKPRRRRRKKA